MNGLDDTEAIRAVIARLVAPAENLPPDGWREACRFCARRFPYLTKWELRFVAELARNQVPPSRKQRAILQDLVARCRNEAA